MSGFLVLNFKIIGIILTLTYIEYLKKTKFNNVVLIFLIIAIKY